MRSLGLVIGTLIATLISTFHPANADVITQSNLTTGQTHQFFSFGGTFNQFDPALGSLNSVSVNFSGNLTFITSWTLDPGRCNNGICSGHAGYSVGFNFNAPGYPLRNSTSAPFYRVVNGGSSADGNDLSTDIFVSAADFGPLYADPGAFSDYIGSGSVGILGSISEDSDFCDNNGVKCTMSSNLNLTTTLIYNFTPIPEPATLALFAAGLLGAGFMWRRQNQRS